MAGSLAGATTAAIGGCERAPSDAAPRHNSVGAATTGDFEASVALAPAEAAGVGLRRGRQSEVPALHQQRIPPPRALDQRSRATAERRA
jgi:hypothetical protein